MRPELTDGNATPHFASLCLSSLLAIVLAAAFALLGACGSVQNEGDDVPPGRPDAALPDGGPGDADARLADAMPIDPPEAAAELNAAAGRASGGGYTIEFQIGHTMPQYPAAGGGRVIEPNTAIKP